jgi:hypothetical protein
MAQPTRADCSGRAREDSRGEGPLPQDLRPKLVYLAQTRDEELAKRAMAAARRLGLAYEYRYAGYGELETSMRKLV